MRLGRRAVLGGLAAAASGPARAEAPPLRILVLCDLASAGTGAVLAARMAVEEFGPGRIARRVEVVSADAGGDAGRGAALVRSWIDHDSVEAVAVVPDDAVAPAVQAVCRERGKVALFCGPTAVALGDGGCGGGGFQWLGDDGAIARAMARGIAARNLGSCRVTAGGAAARARLLVAALEAAGIGMGSGPEVLCDGRGPLPVSGAVMAAGLGPGRLRGAGPAANGVLTVAPYAWAEEGAALGWVRRFLARAERMPEMEEIGVYEAVAHYLRAVGDLGDTRGDRVARQMRFAPVAGPFTRGAPIAADGRVRRPLRVLACRVPPAPSAWDLYAPVLRVPPAPGATSCPG
jgi:branched-chain amino acid transport system substrate-binding protein